ncbi:MAG: carboxypeptidase-like regulatory domain-containing protein [Bacteroidales bacterium]|nr:carboxypeptidase-like regulatory domain-containing protein [Bacteroidales bacterium]
MKKKPVQIAFFSILLFSGAQLFNCFSQTVYLKENITCNFVEEDLAKVLEALGKGIDVNFSYNPDIIPQNKITYQSQSIPLEKILADIFGEGYIFEEFENHVIILKNDSTGKHKYIKTETKEILKKINGQVIEWTTKNPIPYAHVYLTNSNARTISNGNGEFILNIVNPKDDDTLMVSYIGYRNFSILLKYLDSINTLIELKPETYLIKQVIIKPVNAVEIIQMSIKNINHNYDNKPSNLLAFFRETNRLNNQYISISEAVVGIYKSNYAIDYNSDQIKIIKGRKNQNFEPLDEYDFKVVGGLYNNLKLDIVKDKASFIDPESMSKYQYEYEKMVTYKGRNTYVISFDQKDGIDELLYKGLLYIDELSYAIVSAEFQISPKAIKNAASVFIVKKPSSASIKPVFSHYRTDYYYQNGKWHLNNVKSEMQLDILNKKTDTYSTFSTLSEFIITDRITKDVKKFKFKESSKPSDVFVEQIGNYDEGFWGKYNIIKPDKSLIDAYEELKTTTLHIVNNITN